MDNQRNTKLKKSYQMALPMVWMGFKKQNKDETTQRGSGLVRERERRDRFRF